MLFELSDKSSPSVMKTQAEVSLKICVLSLLVIAALGRKPQTLERCSSKTKHYTRTIRVPERACRYLPAKLEPENVRRYQLRPAVPNTPVLRDNKVLAQEVMKSFPGLFLDKKTANELNRKMEKERIRPGKSGINPEDGRGQKKFPKGDHDGDLHCPTYRKLAQAPSSLTNVHRENRDVVHFDSEGVYQYVHKGTCGSSSTQSCNGGSCLQEKSIVYLMVWKDDPDWPTGFEPFEVDSYCSCKSIST